MLPHIDMDDSDGDEDMLMERMEREDREERDSDEIDEDDDLNAEYSNFLKLRMVKERDQYNSIRKRLEKSGMAFGPASTLMKSKKK